MGALIRCRLRYHSDYDGLLSAPTQTFGYFVLVVLLDYVFAFGVLGLAAPFYKLLKKKAWAIPRRGRNRDGACAMSAISPPAY